MRAPVNKLLLTLILLVDLLISAKLVHVSWTGTDKAILVVICYYLMLLVFNLSVWLILEHFKKPAGKAFKISTLVLIILLLPVILISVW